MKDLVFILFLCAGAIAACGDGNSMGQQSQSAATGSDPMTTPDSSMTPTPMMPMMQMAPGKMR